MIPGDLLRHYRQPGKQGMMVVKQKTVQTNSRRTAHCTTATPKGLLINVTLYDSNAFRLAYKSLILVKIEFSNKCM